MTEIPLFPWPLGWGDRPPFPLFHPFGVSLSAAASGWLGDIPDLDPGHQRCKSSIGCPKAGEGKRKMEIGL